MRLTSIFEVEFTGSESDSPFEDNPFTDTADEEENLKELILDGLGVFDESKVKVRVRFLRHRVGGLPQVDC